MLRLIGAAVVAGVFVVGGLKGYNWYESRGPLPHVEHAAEASRGAGAGNIQPSASEALAIFRGIRSKAEGYSRVGGGLAAAPISPGGREVLYSPWENLEQVDSNAIHHSRCNHLDIAMYAFTDRKLAEAVVAFARSGRPVRIYRDREQYEQEMRRGSKVSQILRVPNISIRVKGSPVLMHVKAWSDGCVLREGSANWSPSGEKMQDNTLTFLNDPASVINFERDFQAMWTRSSNDIVQ